LSLFQEKKLKMSSARGNKRVGSCNAYEQEKPENIERNKRKLAILNILAIVSATAISKVRYKTM
jgi:hypothetical protein